jgi:O-succinylbenzoic acid--CoA ligase
MIPWFQDTNSDARRDLGRLMDRRQVLGTAVALRVGSRTWSYAELAARVERRAEWLQLAGVSAAELVLCPTTPVLDSVVMQWALARLGAAMLPIPADLPDARRAALVQATGAEWSWMPATLSHETGLPGASERVAKTAAEGLGDHAPGPGRSEDWPATLATLIRNRCTLEPASAGPDGGGVAGAETPVLLVETSGSSAAPKIVMLSAAQVLASCQGVNKRLDLRCGDRWLGVLPRHHVGGLTIGYRCVLAGAEHQVLWPFSAEATRAALCEQEITHVSLVPAQLERLLNLDPRPPTSLRVVLLGGQGLDSGLARRAVEQGWPLYLGYGMSETCSQIAGGWIGEDGLPRRGLMPLDGVELRCPECSDDKGTPPRSQTLRIRAPMLMLGYANPSRTPGSGLDSGWLQTSDLGCRLPDGGLQVLGRADDVVVIGGINVLPAEIERELGRLERIGEVAVVGVPDPVWGHRLVALYSGDLEPTHVEHWCRTNLAPHRRPRGFQRVERLPTLSSGKRDRRALLKQAEPSATGPDKVIPRQPGSL